MPSEVFIFVICPFLTWSNLCNLDIALCSRKLRSLLYDMYPMLRRVHLCSGIEAIQLKWMFDRSIPMDSLSFEINISDNVLFFLASHPDKCSALTCLDLSMCRNISDVGVIALAQQCRDIKQLNMSFAPIRNESVNQFSQVCHNLTSLDISHCQLLTDEAIQAVAQNCASLTSLCLLRCEGFSSLSLEALALHSSSLTTLCLGSCHLNNQGVIALSKGCRALTSLDLSNSLKSVNSDALIELLGSLRLTVLNLSGKESGVSDAVVLAMACSSRVTLQSLELRGCPITDDAVEALSQHCPGLTSLDVPMCSITDNAVLALASGCRSLTSLDLSDTFVSDVAVEVLSLDFAALKTLDLSCCCCVTVEALRSMDALPDWVVVNVAGMGGSDSSLTVAHRVDGTAKHAAHAV